MNNFIQNLDLFDLWFYVSFKAVCWLFIQEEKEKEVQLLPNSRHKSFELCKACRDMKLMFEKLYSSMEDFDTSAPLLFIFFR
jgi:hypothetical protein